jgi:hypothetical protein
VNTRRESAIIEQARHGLVEARRTAIACQEDNEAVLGMYTILQGGQKHQGLVASV